MGSGISPAAPPSAMLPCLPSFAVHLFFGEGAKVAATATRRALMARCDAAAGAPTLVGALRGLLSRFLKGYSECTLLQSSV